MTIIERILQEAEKKKITQAAIAKHIGKNNNQVTSWKDRNCNPPAEYIPAIAELLGVSVGWLMTGIEEGTTLFPTDETELLNKYRKLSFHDKKEIHAIINYKLEQREPEGIILNSKIG